MREETLLLAPPPLPVPSLPDALERIEHEVRNLHCLVAFDDCASSRSMRSGLDRLQRELDCMLRLAEGRPRDEAEEPSRVSLVEVLDEAVLGLESQLRACDVQVSLHFGDHEFPELAPQGGDLVRAVGYCLAELLDLAKQGSLLEIVSNRVGRSVQLRLDVSLDEFEDSGSPSWNPRLEDPRWRRRHLPFVWAVRTLTENGFQVGSSSTRNGHRLFLRKDLEATDQREIRRVPDDRAAAGSDRTRNPPRSILVVDDSRDAACSWAQVFERCGLRTWVAHDGQSAIDRAVAERPEALLLDLGLPVLDGIEVTRRMRSLLPDVQIVVLTGFSDPTTHTRAIAAGCDKLLVKPVPLVRLLQEFGLSIV